MLWWSRIEDGVCGVKVMVKVLCKNVLDIKW